MIVNFNKSLLPYCYDISMLIVPKRLMTPLNEYLIKVNFLLLINGLLFLCVGTEPPFYGEWNT